MAADALALFHPIVAQWFVMRAAKEAGLTVMLDGQGADETLAGYHGDFGPFFGFFLFFVFAIKMRRISLSLDVIGFFGGCGSNVRWYTRSSPPLAGGTK